MRRRPPRTTQTDLGAVKRGRGTTRARRVRLGGIGAFGVVLLLSAIVASALVLSLHSGSSLPTGQEGAPASMAVVIVLDGVGTSDLSHASMPNLQALERHGTRYSDAWIGQLEEGPAPSAASIATGVFPRSHGILGSAWTDSQGGIPSTVLDPQQVELGSIDQVMESHSVPTLARQIKNRAPGDRILAVGGSGCAAAAAGGTWLADYILCATRDGQRWAPASVAGHRPPSGSLSDVSWSVPADTSGDLGGATEGWALGAQDTWVARYAASAIRQTRPRLAVIDFPEVGLVGPYVPAARRVAVIGALLAGIDHGIGLITAELKREGRLKHAVFAITSGGTTTLLSDSIPQSKLTDAIQTAGGNPVYTLGDGMTYVGLQDAIQAQPVAQAMQGENISTIDSIYFRSRQGDSYTYAPVFLNPQLPARASDSTAYLLRTLASAGSPDVVVGYAPGVGTIGHTGRFARSALSQGMNWEDQHIPLILSGQGVFPGVVSSFPARLVDMAPTLEALLGLDAARGDGMTLADAMYNAPGGAADRQKTTAATLAPLVQALKQRQAAG